MKSAPHILWFKDIRKKDLPVVGGKGANLGEMTSVNIPVPEGFCVTAPAYFYFLDANNLRDAIKDALQDVDVTKMSELNAVSRHIKKLITRAEIPTDLANSITEAYSHLPNRDRTYVAVRSSATAEDLPDASFAGQQASYLNISGDTNVLKAVRDCWASLFEARAIFYRAEKGFDHFKVGIAVPIQKMVQSEVSGVMFTVNPIDNDPETIVVECVWGLGEMIVQGSTTPDHFEINKHSWKITNKIIAKQTMQLTKVGDSTEERPIPKSRQEIQKLSDKVIVELAKVGLKLQNHYNFPQDIEWAYQDGEIYIVQTRPVTTFELGHTKTSSAAISETSIMIKKGNEKPLLTGSAASPGVVTGIVRILHHPSEIDRVRQGDILVTSMTTPDFVPAMKRAAAIVTDQGGQTSHAAIISRELGVPCIVGTMKATSILKNNQVITIDAQNGQVYDGRHEIRKQQLKMPAGVHSIHEVKTKTKVMVNLGEPGMAEAVARKYVDGVGLLRAEFIISEYIGIHPRKLLADGRRAFFVNKLAEGLAEFCHAFAPRPIIYRTTDFKTNEYRGLEGGEEFEPQEPNPMLGYRGCYRYLEDEEVFRMELDAIKKVRNKLGHTNLHMMVPFVRTVDQLVQIKKLMFKHGVKRTSNFFLYMMVEIPSNVFLLDQFIDVGIDGVSIGSNDLTMLILGTDRDNELVSDVFNELDPAVQYALEKICKTSKARGIQCSICGQAPSLYPELTRNLVKWGATSVSVSVDMIDRTRITVHEAERSLKRSNRRTARKEAQKKISG